jgi:hypothetical protein
MNSNFKNETYLRGINEKTTLIEIKNILSLETGESMNIFIKRDDEKTISKNILCLFFS